MHPLIKSILRTLPVTKPVKTLESKRSNYAIEQYKTAEGDAVLIVFFPDHQESLVLGFLTYSHPERLVAYCDDLLDGGVSTLGELQRQLNISAKDNAWNDNILTRDNAEVQKKTLKVAKPIVPIITSLREVARDTTGNKAVIVTTDLHTGLIFRADLDAIAREIQNTTVSSELFNYPTARTLIKVLVAEAKKMTKITAGDVVESQAFQKAIRRPITATIKFPQRHEQYFPA